MNKKELVQTIAKEGLYRSKCGLDKVYVSLQNKRIHDFTLNT